MKICEIDVNCLIDTGSTITVLHPSKYAAISQDLRPALEPSDVKLRMADGGLVASQGYANFPIEVQGRKFQHRIMVADVEAPAVLGYAFLMQNNCQIDMGHGRIQIGGLSIKCTEESELPSVFRITLAEYTVVPPASEMILPGRIEGDLTNFSDVIVEPYDARLSQRGIMVAKVLVNPSEEHIPIRVLNVTDQP